MNAAHRPSPALIVALVALSAAIAGTATALPGKNTVDKNDIKRNAVKSKTIKNGQVKAADIADGAVGTAEIADASVGTADLTPNENFQRVTAFGTGGDGDCIWSRFAVAELPLNPPAYFIDRDGIVHLAGLITAEDGAGGDGVCDELIDGQVFVLPPAYRPENVEVIFTGQGDWFFSIYGDEDVAFPGLTVPAGSVIIQPLPADGVSLDGITFRAAGAGDNGLTPTRTRR